MVFHYVPLLSAKYRERDYQKSITLHITMAINNQRKRVPKGRDYEYKQIQPIFNSLYSFHANMLHSISHHITCITFPASLFLHYIFTPS